MIPMYRRRHVLSLIALLSLLSFLGILVFKERTAQRIVQECKNTEVSIRKDAFFDAQELSAKAAFVKNFTKGEILYEKNPEMVLPLASLTKLMTARMALENSDPLAVYTLTEEDLEPLGSVGFITGERYTIESLLKAALISSSNDAALALARSTKLSEGGYFIAMNASAKGMGLSTLRFESPTGLDAESTDATVYGSPRDILSLLYFNYRDFPEIFEWTTAQSYSIRSLEGTLSELKNTNTALSRLPLLIASKTGYTDAAGGNLAVLWKEKGDIFGSVVLGSTQTNRFDDTVFLYNRTRALYGALESLPSLCKNYYES